MTRREFTERYLPLNETLYKVAYYIMESREEAEDVVQDMYVRLWNSLDSLDMVGNPKAYCVTVIRNMCLDRLRRADRYRMTELDDSISEDACESGPTEEREKVERVMQAMEGLSKSERTVFEMRFLQDMSYEDIEKTTGMKNLTLRVLISRARKKIRNMV